MGLGLEYAVTLPTSWQPTYVQPGMDAASCDAVKKHAHTQSASQQTNTRMTPQCSCVTNTQRGSQRGVVKKQKRGKCVRGCNVKQYTLHNACVNLRTFVFFS